MKILPSILLFLIAIINISCEEERVESSYRIDSYSFKFMYPHEPIISLPGEETYKNLYQGTRFIKRIGGLNDLDPSSGYNYAFTLGVSYNIQYSGDSILLIEIHSYDNFKDSTLVKAIVLNYSGQMISQIEYNDGWNTVITNYTYNSKNQIAESESLKSGKPNEFSKYYFNSRGNLDSVVTYGSFSKKRKIVEIFKGYDNSPNPLKNSFIFKETFYRSLSRNNYTEYIKKDYTFSISTVKTSNVKWKLSYGLNGYPTFR
jgi:hypothetical protein